MPKLHAENTGHDKDNNRRDLFEALSIADSFEEFQQKDGFLIPEGWDIHETLKAVVTLARHYRLERDLNRKQDDLKGGATCTEEPLAESAPRSDPEFILKYRPPPRPVPEPLRPIPADERARILKREPQDKSRRISFL